MVRAGPPIEPLTEGLVSGLAAPEAYPDDASAAAGVSHLQTHISHLFLTRDRVYKLRKAVRFDFLDFAARAERNRDCLREVRLNRRLAPDVYLGVATARCEGGRVRVAPAAEALAAPDPVSGVPEHCVVMRRLPDGRDGQTLLEQGKLRPEQLDAVADRVAEFHAAHGLGPLPFPPAEWRRRVEAPVRESFAVLADAAQGPEFEARRERAEGRVARFLTTHWPRFEARLREGRIVDGHGDLQLQHVWFETEAGPPVVIDCIEFRDDYRQIDAASEVAFFAMDLRYRGGAILAERFLGRYASAADDFGLYGVVDYFVAYRSAVRAKVASLAQRDPEISPVQREGALESAQRHLALCERALPEGPRGRLIVLAGIVGSGKSSAAAELAALTGGVVIASDRVRKQLAGLRPSERGDAPELGLYTPERTRAVYVGLRERARPVLESGRTAILDATYARRALRDELRQWAEAQGLRPLLLETLCSRQETLDRLTRRRALGRDPSDAGPEFYEASASLWEAPEEWPADQRLRLRTDRPEWRRELRALARRADLGSR